MLNKILYLITPKAHAQESVMGEFRNLVCPDIINTNPDCKDMTGNDALTCCMTHLDLSDTIVLVNVLVRIAFGLAGIIALIYLIYAGYLYMTSLGNPDSQAAAKSKLLHTVLGLVIIIVAYLLVAFILETVGPP
ncbi:pilin, partial [Patescibacteria group bacterium]|nr:pilin [Patescibacteria group bacterium]